jgi:large subunit ribosomal protein L15
MKFNELTVEKNKKPTRVGRGIAAGKGKTAGRGTKGQKSRAGSGKKPGFEGGQNPLFKRVPKLRGFKPFWEQSITITTSQLNRFEGLVDNFTLYEAKLLKSPSNNAKVVVRGELKSKVDVKIQGASQGAIDLITKAGGSFEKVDRVKSAGKSDNDN